MIKPILKLQELSLETAQLYLSHSVESDLREIVKTTGFGTLVLTGGKSIQNFLPHLQKIEAPWDKLTLLLSDDRLVSSTMPDSNECMLKEKFLNENFSGNHPRYQSIKEAHLKDSQGLYQSIEDSLKHSVVILSMGADGHLASLFSTKDIISNEGILIKVTRPDFNRISLSYKALLMARRTYIIVYGQEKVDYFKRLDLHTYYLKELLTQSNVILVDSVPL